ncbi:hypothetical protein DY000_02003304 [Brassica cretica]|uniref:Uncharacterized protein n=1 Tax=Brassica cretica TaxID=69181 RepID=A0ABQ7BX82_BRACR|nr:hypothetical protein DY000_02003304 [Brassica cretica]
MEPTSTREPLFINNTSSALELSQLNTSPFESSSDQVNKILLKEQNQTMSSVYLAVGPGTDVVKTSATSVYGQWLEMTIVSGDSTALWDHIG